MPGPRARGRRGSGGSGEVQIVELATVPGEIIAVLDVHS